jgi:hypothetical protein
MPATPTKDPDVQTYRVRLLPHKKYYRGTAARCPAEYTG